MRSAMLSAVATLAIWSALYSPAAACKCALPDVTRSYDTAEVVLHVRVLGLVPAPAGLRRYLAVTVDKPLKGCVPALSLVLLQSSDESASCGVIFALGSEQLVFGSSEGRRFGLPLLTTGSCQGNREYAGLSTEERGFLATRWNCCGAACGCVASTQVECLVNPCDVNACNVPDATCTANYCGGCGAEWRDASGARVCQSDSASCEDPDRRYVARGAEACKAVRFLCESGTQAFFDECGCGCLAQHPTILEPCRTGGCSGELCLSPDDANMVSACVFRPEYACYRSSTCAPQSSGTCGYTETPELAACIQAARSSTSP
jgi:hypothetical protein